MNILNNLWLAVSTPNATLINIFLIFSLFFIETPLTFFIICNIFNLNYTKKQKFIYIICTNFMALLGMSIFKNPFNIFFNYLCNFIIIYFTFKLGFLKNIIASIFPSIIFNIIGALLLKPYLTCFSISYEQIESILIYRIPFLTLLYLLVFLFAIVLKYRKISIQILDDFDKKNKSIITLNFIFGFFNIIVQGILTVNYTDILPIQFTFFNFVSLSLYFGLSFFSLAKIISLTTTEKKLESAEEYNKTLHILHDSVRGFKHDFDNIVTTIGGYVKTNDMEGLKNYYSQLEEDCSKVNNLYVLNPDIINNPGVYNLLTSKYSEAEEKDIKINLTFLLDLNNLHMKIYEFTRILGILLDNAIEAASECDEKEINIVFRNESKNNRNTILIENTYKDKDVNIEQIFNKGVTGKENHTGLGLWEIMQILKKNNNVNLHTDKGKKYFSQQLEIYY